MKFIETIKKNKLRLGFLVFLFFMTFCVGCLGITTYLVRNTNIVNPFYLEIPEDLIVSYPTSSTISVSVGEDKVITVPKGYFLNIEKLPPFIKYSNNSLVISPKKFDDGEYVVEFKNGMSTIKTTVEVSYAKVDSKSMINDLSDYLNSKGIFNKYGIYIKDLGRNISSQINGSTDFPPASMAKLTMAVLVLRDIEAGKYTLDTTYPIQDSVKFSTEDDLGVLPNGTPVPIHTYLEKLIEDSNNTAWYHIDKFLGGSYEAVDPRTVTELGVNVFLNPHKGTPVEMGQILNDIYNARTLSAKSRDYLINLMKNALEWNRQGIGLGLPDGVQFANKIGNLWTENDINFCDSAIVYGKNTDYILIIMDKDIDWVSGKQNLADLSKIVYSYLDK